LVVVPVSFYVKVYNIIKNGSTVPLKFEIFAGPTKLTDVSSIQMIIQYEINCIKGEFINDCWTILTAGEKLVYDPAGGQFVYRWRVSKSVGKCYQVTMVMQEYSTLSVNFKVK